jgi:hypothetical protein
MTMANLRTETSANSGAAIVPQLLDCAQQWRRQLNNLDPDGSIGASNL